MSDIKKDFSEAELGEDERVSYFSQAGQMSDSSLIQLRDQIKKVMIPLLIKIFQLKLELSQSIGCPSRLQSQKNLHSPQEILEQLRSLDNDLKVLFLWCQSCRSQIQKALSASEEEQRSTISSKIDVPAHPAIFKSFNEAISAQASFFQNQTPLEENADSMMETKEDLSSKNWWNKFLRKN